METTPGAKFDPDMNSDMKTIATERTDVDSVELDTKVSIRGCLQAFADNNSRWSHMSGLLAQRL